MDSHEIANHPIHLGLGATAVIAPPLTGVDWFEAYGARHLDDGVEGRLVCVFRFDEPWPTWEVHPNGHEVVLCLAGTITLHQEHPDGRTASVTLTPGRYAINPPGVWHTADVDGEAEALFITAGAGTELRPR